MNAKVKEMREWFTTLSNADKEAVLQVLYGRGLERRGLYVGPPPGMININEGLYCGPAPATTPSSCSTCGRPF